MKLQEEEIHKEKLEDLFEQDPSNEAREYVTSLLFSKRYPNIEMYALRVLARWASDDDIAEIKEWFKSHFNEVETTKFQNAYVEPLRVLARFGELDWLKEQFIINFKIRGHLGFVFRTLSNQVEIVSEFIKSTDPFLRKSAIDEIMFSLGKYKSTLEYMAKEDSDSGVRFAARLRLRFLEENPTHFP